MSEASKHRVMVKGGKFLEAFANADTIVFDKTGTLTIAEPKVEKIIPFAGFDREYILKTAACLEEHFPHSVAQAIVRQATEEGIYHQEEHSEVEYVVAHGVSSRLHGERILIGSAHFIFDDEHIVPTPEQRAVIDNEAGTYSVLYLAIGSQLAGILCISDPLRPEAEEVVRSLKRLGIRKVVMLTGDSPQAAGAVAARLELDEYQAQVLPEDKAYYIRSLVEAGRSVIMVGDGVNDSPALTAASVGIAMKDSSDIAREVSDITLLDSRLDDLVYLRELSMKAMNRIKGNYTFIMSFNSLILALGLRGLTTPGTGALLHNLSTLGVSLNSSRKLVK
jgi:P-type E1-E2 ATPase